MMYLELFGGLTYLLLGGDLLVRGAVALARRAGISPLVVGLTVVAFGTSAPELCISLGAVFSGHPDISIGNVVGSNIANVLLVLGVPALIYPTVCDQESLGRNTALVVAASLLFVSFCFLGPLGRIQGAVMFTMLVLVLWRAARTARESDEGEHDAEFEGLLGLPESRALISLFVVLGIVLLPLGADLMLDGAVQLATRFGVPSAVIGLSVVALGTSLPELATTVVAAFQRHSDLALGNVIGSNLFNLLAIMGLAAMLSPAPIAVPPGFLRFDLLVMLAATGVLFFFAWRGRSIGRAFGLVLLTAYALYLGALFSTPAPVTAMLSIP
ncbi:MAG: calcium/sodium antiporter [Myxococcota bacterium]